MTRSWNGKAIIDAAGKELWDTSSTYRAELIRFANEIQDDIASKIPQEYFRHRLKKLLPTQQEEISLEIQKGSAPTVEFGSFDQTLNYNTSTEGSYAFNSNKIEFDSEKATLKLLEGAQGDETCAGKWLSSSLNLTRGAGTLVGTGTGSPVVTSGKLDLTGALVKYVDYDADQNTDSQQSGCVRFKLTPNYTGSPSTTMVFLAINEDASSSTVNRVDILQFTSGNLSARIWDSSGVKQVDITDAWSPSSGTEYEFELNWDITAGVSRFFIDGVQFSTTNAGTGVRSSAISLLRFGSDPQGVNTSDFKIDDFQYFSTVQHTTDFAGEIPRTVSTYSTDDPKITLASGLSIGELIGFTADIATPTNTAVQFILNVDGQDKYWDGAAWSNSDGTFSQSNTASDINTNAPALLSASATIKVVALLNNSSDNDRPSISQVVMTDQGALENGTEYIAYTTFVIYDQDNRKYIESDLGEASLAITADLSNQSICVSSIDTFDGDTSIEPTTIYRRIYVSKKESTDTEHGEPFFYKEIQDNTTTQTCITTESTSTITPPSDSEIDQLTSDHLYFESTNRYLRQSQKNRLRRYDPDSGETTTPESFDYAGPTKILLYKKLSSSATDAQRTLSYFVYRRPHEIFYDISREIDLPIVFKRAFMQGVRARGFFYDDRDGKVTEYNLYEQLRDDVIDRLNRQRGRPGIVRDVDGDTMGWEIT